MSLKIRNIFDEYENIDLYNYFRHCGITDVREYLNPSGKYNCNPYGFKNIHEGINLFKYHLLNHSLIGVLCDSDSDGITSTSIVYRYIKRYDKTIKIKLYLHDGKERGIADDKVYNKILKDNLDLLIIPDAGSEKTGREKVLLDKGTDLLVLDHHDADNYIEHGVLINNRLEDNIDIDRNLSGCGVTYKFLSAMDKELGVKFSDDFIDLVGLSVLSDSMPLNDYENRYYVYKLLTLQSVKNPLLYELIYMYCNKDELTTKDVSWTIIPKINAVIRSDDTEFKQTMLLAFCGKSKDFEAVAKECGKYHQSQYEYVKSFVDNNIDNAMIGKNVILLLSKDMKRSYSGLIAGSISGRYNNKPTIVAKLGKDNEAIGSFRDGGFISRNTIKEIVGINWAKGHDDNAFAVNIDGTKSNELFDSINALKLDYSTKLDVIQTMMVNNIPKDLFGVFEPLNGILGEGMLTTDFCIKNIRIKPREIKVIGKKLDTVKIILDDKDVLFFKVSREKLTKDFHIVLDDDGTINYNDNSELNITVVGQLGINVYKGKKTNQILVKDYEVISNVFD